VEKQKVVIFGGAIGTAKEFSITDETYMFETDLHKWTKITRK
jgi:hypothetical protein